MGNLLDLTLNGLEELCAEYGEKRFRAQQIFGWLSKGVAEFDEMSNVPKSLRDRLSSDGWY